MMNFLRKERLFILLAFSVIFQSDLQISAQTAEEMAAAAGVPFGQAPAPQAAVKPPVSAVPNSTPKPIETPAAQNDKTGPKKDKIFILDNFPMVDLDRASYRSPIEITTDLEGKPFKFTVPCEDSAKSCQENPSAPFEYLDLRVGVLRSAQLGEHGQGAALMAYERLSDQEKQSGKTPRKYLLGIVPLLGRSGELLKFQTSVTFSNGKKEQFGIIVETKNVGAAGSSQELRVKVVSETSAVASDQKELLSALICGLDHQDCRLKDNANRIAGDPDPKSVLAKAARLKNVLAALNVEANFKTKKFRDSVAYAGRMLLNLEEKARKAVDKPPESTQHSEFTEAREQALAALITLRDLAATLIKKVEPILLAGSMEFKTSVADVGNWIGSDPDTSVEVISEIQPVVDPNTKEIIGEKVSVPDLNSQLKEISSGEGRYGRICDGEICFLAIDLPMFKASLQDIRKISRPGLNPRKLSSLKIDYARPFLEETDCESCGNEDWANRALVLYESDKKIRGLAADSFRASMIAGFNAGNGAIDPKEGIEKVFDDGSKLLIKSKNPKWKEKTPYYVFEAKIILPPEPPKPPQAEPQPDIAPAPIPVDNSKVLDKTIEALPEKSNDPSTPPDASKPGKNSPPAASRKNPPGASPEPVKPPAAAPTVCHPKGNLTTYSLIPEFPLNTNNKIAGLPSGPYCPGNWYMAGSEQPAHAHGAAVPVSSKHYDYFCCKKPSSGAPPSKCDKKENYIGGLCVFTK